MTIPTNDGRTGESEPLFRSDDMDDPLPTISHSKVSQSEFLDIVFERSDLGARVGFLDERVDGFE